MIIPQDLNSGALVGSAWDTWYKAGFAWRAENPNGCVRDRSEEYADERGFSFGNGFRTCRKAFEKGAEDYSSTTEKDK